MELLRGLANSFDHIIVWFQSIYEYLFITKPLDILLDGTGIVFVDNILDRFISIIGNLFPFITENYLRSMNGFDLLLGALLFLTVATSIILFVGRLIDAINPIA